MWVCIQCVIWQISTHSLNKSRHMHECVCVCVFVFYSHLLLSLSLNVVMGRGGMEGQPFSFLIDLIGEGAGWSGSTGCKMRVWIFGHKHSPATWACSSVYNAQNRKKKKEKKNKTEKCWYLPTMILKIQVKDNSVKVRLCHNVKSSQSPNPLWDLVWSLF